MYRAHIRAHSRDVCIGKHHEYTGRRTGETYAFTLDSDRARVSKLYSLFHAGKPRGRLDQPDPAGRTRTSKEKEGKKKRKGERGGKRLREREREIVKRYLSHELREKSMSTAVNYDKCRECDAAISRYRQRCAGQFDRAAERATFYPPCPSRPSMGRMPYIQRLTNCGSFSGASDRPANTIYRMRDCRKATSVDTA